MNTIQRNLLTTVTGIILAALIAGCDSAATHRAQGGAAVKLIHSVDLTTADWKCTWTGDASRVQLESTELGPRIQISGKPAGGQKGAVVSTPVQGLRLTLDSSVELTAHTDSTSMKMAIAVRAGEYFESRTQTIKPGNPQELYFDLAASTFKSASSGWEHTASINMDEPMQFLEVILYPAKNEEHVLYLDNITLSGAAPPRLRPERSIASLSFEGFAASTEAVQFQKYEIATHISQACNNPFDPAEIQVDAVFTSPSGEQKVCPAFLSNFAASEHDPDDWRVRFSPHEPGSWRWKLIARTPTEKAESPTHEFTCMPASTPGPLQVANDTRYFEHADGSFYYPIGHNVCWNSLQQYRDQFRKMGENGENWSRIWLAPWNCEIEWSSHVGAYEGLAQYNLDRAEKIDQILELAEENGIYLQLVFHEHCRVSAKTNPEWHNNPYNEANGGPCADPTQFFTHPEARRMQKNRIRYLIARYGYSDHVMAWELFNEADLADDYHFDRDLEWHKDMAAYIKRTDPHGRMVATSYISNPNAQTYSLDNIDFTQSHVYSPKVIYFFNEFAAAYRLFDKPHFVGEFGRDPMDGVDTKDTQGKVLHTGIWSQFMLPSGGNAMSWWWYDLIDPADLYYHFNALSEYAHGIDRRGVDWQPQTGMFPTKKERAIRVLALTSPKTVLLWMYDPEVLPWGDKDARPFTGILKLAGLAKGTWIIEVWDTRTGKIIAHWEPTVVDELLPIPVEAQGPDIAFKLMYTGDETNPETPTVVLAPWSPVGQRKRNKITVPQAVNTVTIDGRLNEWVPFPQRTFGPGKDKTPKDNSVAFSLQHDGETLLIAARVKDDTVLRQHSVTNDLWKDDCLELWIDSRFDAEGYFNNMPHNQGCYQINIAPATADKRLEHVVYRHPTMNNQVLDVVEAASQLTEDGYTIEARIPLEALRGPDPVNDSSVIGFNMSTCDADDDWSHLLWQGTDEWDARQWSEAKLITNN